MAFIELKNVSKSYHTSSDTFKAVESESLEIEESDIYGIIGFSGAGKSTLLRMINLLERPDEGSVKVNGQDLTRLTEKELLRARQSIGMIFQHFNLLNNLTVYQNVSFPLEIAGLPKHLRKQRIEECLAIVGLEDKINAYPAKLSGGQKQRVAIARALANQPQVLLCDEPTSALDPFTTESILEFLQDINKKLGITIVIVTHEMHVIRTICTKVSVMDKGRIVESFAAKDAEYIPKSDIGQFLYKNENFSAKKVEYV